jgi:hypothetical protein
VNLASITSDTLICWSIFLGCLSNWNRSRLCFSILSFFFKKPKNILNKSKHKEYLHNRVQIQQKVKIKVISILSFCNMFGLILFVLLDQKIKYFFRVENKPGGPQGPSVWPVLGLAWPVY